MRASVAMLLLTVVCILTLVAGCTDSSRWEVQPLPNEYLAELDADDVARVMRRSGFSDDLILELGPRVRNALATNGATRVLTGHSVEAIFAVEDNLLYAASRRRGSFIYELHENQFR